MTTMVEATPGSTICKNIPLMDKVNNEPRNGQRPGKGKRNYKAIVTM